MIKLAVFDLDDTLLNPDKTMQQETIDTIKTLKEEGINVGIATGRNYEMTKPFAQAIGVEGPIVCNNGALIRDIRDDSSIIELFVDKAVQAYVIDYAIKHNYVYIIYTNQGVFTSNEDRLNIYNQWNKNFPTSPINLTLSSDIDALKALDAFKILVVIDNPQMLQQVYDLFKSLDNAHATQSSSNFLDVIPKDVNKGVGLTYLMDYYHVKPEETMVFGDSDNDSEMLALTPHSYAMSNATNLAKDKANHITKKPAAEAGVAKTLKEKIINKN